MPKKPTIRSIAEASGVSRGTVDRVINNRPNVSPAVRAKVLAVAAEQGYDLQRARPDDAALRIGVLIPQWEDAYFTDHTRRGIEDAIRRLAPYPVTIISEQMNSRSDNEYIRRTEALLAQGVKGLVLNAPDNIMVRAQVERLAARGVPVVTFNSDLTDSPRICHVGQNLIRSGAVAAGLLHLVTGGSGRVLVVTGNPEFRVHRARVDGFCERMIELGWPRERVEIAACYEKEELVYQAVADALRRYRDLTGIFMGAESVKGRIEAISRAPAGRRIHVVANDLTPQNRRFLRTGRLDFVLEQEFSAQVYEAVMTLYRYLAYGHQPAKEVRYVRTTVVTAEMLK